MANRNLLFMPAVLAGIALVTVAPGDALAADGCLARPKGPPPAGKHWYYQTNRTTQRKCWFLDDEGLKVTATTRRKPAVAESAADAAQQTRVRPPIASAHAELISEPQAEPVTSAAQSRPTTQEAQPETGKSQQRSDDGTNSSNWALVSRWPDASIATAFDRTPIVKEPVQAPQTEHPRPVLAASNVVPDEQLPAAVDDAGYVFFAQLAAGLSLSLFAGAAIFLLAVSRRRARPIVAGPQRVRDAIEQGAMRRSASRWANVSTEDSERLTTNARHG